MKGLPIRRGVLVVAVVALVAVAGCSGLSGDTTPTANETSTANASENTTATSTATPSENTTATPLPDTVTETPDDSESTPDDSEPTPDDSEDDSETNSSSSVETDEAGADLDGAALNNATRTAVEDAGSYTYQSAVRSATQSERGQSTSEFSTTTQVDFDAEQGIRVTNQVVSSQQYNQNSTTTVYTEDNTSYQERVTSEGTNYSTQEGEPTGFGGIAPVNTTNFDQNLTFATDVFTWEENTTTTVDGDTVTQYDFAGIEDPSVLTGGADDATLTDIDGTLYVDDDDVIRQVSIVYSIEGDSRTTSTQLQFTLTDIGSTTVEEPDWTSEAEDADSS